MTECGLFALPPATRYDEADTSACARCSELRDGPLTGSTLKREGRSIPNMAPRSEREWTGWPTLLESKPPDEETAVAIELLMNDAV
jgi:hypothetical protein